LSAHDLAVIQRRRAAAKTRARRVVETISEEKDAATTAAAMADVDNPPLREDAVLTPAHEVHPQLVAEQLHRKRGRPKSETPKRQVTLRLDRDVVAGLRASGRGWQTRVNTALRNWLKRQRA
jgi:uncharacterized protein (DUF4415 family)